MAQSGDPAAAPEVRIEFITDGPVKITGGVTLVTEDGAVERQDRVFLCRCGGSARKPFCDGTPQEERIPQRRVSGPSANQKGRAADAGPARA